MSSTGMDCGAAGKEAQECRPPGVYRTAAGVRVIGSSNPPAAPADPTTATHEKLPLSSEDDPSAADARRRFYQLRAVRRELSGRPAVLDSNSSVELLPPAASASPPVIRVHPTPFPVPTSYGLSLDRLSAEDPATRYILRTAAAERALRHQQAEGDHLKRLLITQQQEASNLRQQLECLSRELAASSQTVLRQTATMRSLTSEMERRDAYHLIKERRASNAGMPPLQSTSETGGALPKEQQQIEALVATVKQLQSEKGLLEQQVQQLRQRQNCSLDVRGTCTPTIEAIERDEDESAAGISPGDGAHHGKHNTWIPFAAEELQKLVHSLGCVLRGASPRNFVCSASPTALPSPLPCRSDLVLEVVLSDLSFTVASSSEGGHSCSSKRPGSFLCEDHGVLLVCGPYNCEQLLLRTQPANAQMAPAPSTHRRPLSNGQQSRRCCFYTLLDTQGVLTFRFFEKMHREVMTPAVGATDDSPAPTATATVPVRSLIAAAGPPFFSEPSCGKTTLGASTVHTLHLHKEGCAASCGAATFVARVTAVQPTPPTDRMYRSGERESHAGRADDSVRASLLHSPIGRVATPGATATTAVMEEAAARKRTHMRPRAPLISPSREDGETGLTRLCSTPCSSKQASERTTPLLHRAPPLVAEAKPQRSPSPTLPSAVSACESLEGSDTIPTVEAEAAKQREHGKPVSQEEDTIDTRSSPAPAPFAETLPPSKAEGSQSHLLVLSAKGIPLPPLVRVPPAPPVATLPSPPPASVPAIDLPDAAPSALQAASSTPSSSPTTEMHASLRIYVKALRDFHCGASDDVEGLLEHCAVRVRVYVGETEVFVAPTRRNPSHAVWSAEEGVCSVALSAAQDLRFEVMDAAKATTEGALAQATVQVADVMERWGERELALTTVTDSIFCGALTVCFSSSVAVDSAARS
ncbi:hypothetical protein ABL78_1647 [Leptomonas seymouri]|uniref:Uncharacterized protein n=1 Tax=Leptomonas seymouri TaxID=5684 RepID=A0A0N1IM17_LEPSE|nr:hypothetical protein ABL78_1647 [Leptomonas seymouri]|eukprot:KPI89224.1 hypothetical protein ABL78_1647 [Leptomonas seymouri]